MLPFRRLKFPSGLKMTQPHPINLRVKPYPATAFKVLIWILVTNTKIHYRPITHALANASIQPPHPRTHLRHKTLPQVALRCLPASVPSLFKADSFCRWLVTQSLANFDFRGHDSAVSMNQHIFELHRRIIRRLNHPCGSSRIVSFANQKWPTKS